MQVNITRFLPDCWISEIRGLRIKQPCTEYFYSPYEPLKHSISFIAWVCGRGYENSFPQGKSFFLINKYLYSPYEPLKLFISFIIHCMIVKKRGMKIHSVRGKYNFSGDNKSLYFPDIHAVNWLLYRTTSVNLEYIGFLSLFYYCKVIA